FLLSRFSTSMLRYSCLSHMSSFFLYSYAHHRYLHSFPTRRSSDLSIGAFGFGLSQILFLWIALKVTVLGQGEKAGQRPWDGADTLEWTHLPSPAPYHSFHEQPVLG